MGSEESKITQMHVQHDFTMQFTLGFIWVHINVNMYYDIQNWYYK